MQSWTATHTLLKTATHTLLKTATQPAMLSRQHGRAKKISGRPAPDFPALENPGARRSKQAPRPRVHTDLFELFEDSLSCCHARRSGWTATSKSQTQDTTENLTHATSQTPQARV